MSDQLDVLSVTALKGVGPKVAESLARLNILTVHDLLFHLPLRYEDRTRIYSIADVKPGDRVLIEGAVTDVQVVGARRYLRCLLKDDSGAVIQLVFFHFVHGHQKKLSKVTSNIRCFGEVRQSYSGGVEIVHPEYALVSQIADDGVLSPSDRLSPVYPTTKGLQQVTLRKLILQGFGFIKEMSRLRELLPEQLLASFQSFGLQDALQYVHFPPVGVDQEQLRAGNHPAMQRLAFEELIAHQLGLQVLRHRVHGCKATTLPIEHKLSEQLLSQLPFALTGAQSRVVKEISQDLSQQTPMLRLVQGDVGSGKTIVACLAALQALASGYQVAVMAPTEILSEQHFQNFTTWLEPMAISVGHLTGRQTAATQKSIREKIADGQLQLIIGTHALFQKSVEFKKLGLLIIDEQHRFGVHQRLALLEKGLAAGVCPHQLIMTATPIPRTLAMTAYADLDCSTIDELPPGRKAITTVLIDNDRRDEVIDRVQASCTAGKQAYWVCTLVEESEVLQCQAAEDAASALQQTLPHLRVGLVHGQLKADVKQQVMQRFKAGEIDLLVATTVIEVGVDVPNASLMVIENPERFGLAQLHQLRGRVGRGSAQSFCVLLYQHPLSAHAKQRLQAMRETQDGFKIAEYDLEMRGAGEMLGVRQSGMMQFKIADVLRDQALLPDVQAAGRYLVEHYPSMVPLLLKRWVGEQIKYVNA